MDLRRLLRRLAITFDDHGDGDSWGVVRADWGASVGAFASEQLANQAAENAQANDPEARSFQVWGPAAVVQDLGRDEGSWTGSGPQHPRSLAIDTEAESLVVTFTDGSTRVLPFSDFDCVFVAAERNS